MRIQAVVFFLLIAPAAFAFAEDHPARVVRVADGDTLAVLLNGKVQTVRLNAIDCPEMGQSYGAVAKRMVEEATGKKVVTIRSYKIDRHGRIIGDIFLQNGESLAQRLFRSGACRRSRSSAPSPDKKESGKD